MKWFHGSQQWVYDVLHSLWRILIHVHSTYICYSIYVDRLMLFPMEPTNSIVITKILLDNIIVDIGTGL